MQPHHDPYHACRSVIIIVIHIHCHHLVRSARTSLEYLRYPPENCNKSFFLPTPSGCTVLSKHCQAMYVNAVCCSTSLFPSVQLISCDSKLLFSYQTQQHQFDAGDHDADQGGINCSILRSGIGGNGEFERKWIAGERDRDSSTSSL